MSTAPLHRPPRTAAGEAGAAAKLVTFGCRLNAFETEVMREHAEAAGLERAIIVNSCAVTGEAVRQARQAIRRARRENPGATIIVTGCAAQTDPGGFASMDEVDHVVGNAEKLRPETFAALAGTGAPRVLVDDIMSVRETAGHLARGFGGRARAFVQIQTGCDHRCTFCIIPFGRGPSRSVPMGAVIDQIRRLVDEGHAEIVLTGVDITSYGTDLPGTPALGGLVRRILRHVPELPRLRISSIDSVETDDEFVDVLANEERLMPHLHLSLQAGDPIVLKRMKRRHSPADALAFCDRARRARPDIVFGADVIAGFPTETEAMFRNTLEHVEDCGLTWLHVFPFSARPGTPAARMPQIPRTEIKQRAARLRAAGEAMRTRFAERERGAVRSVLLERPGFGRTEHYAEVDVAPDERMRPGAVFRTSITGGSDGRLAGRLVP